MRMLNFYINRAGKNLTESRIKVLEQAKDKLSAIIASEKESTTAKKSAPKNTSSKAAKKKSTTK